ncbi:MAG: Ku protein [Solirubrobacterales bacterium]|nr:Ku protein [Solirubrobacterales bacterium]
MPRSIWNGTIAFGMVRVPVKLYSAIESKSVSFRERNLTDGAAIEHRRFCEHEGVEVPYAEIAKGFEIRPGEFVVLSKEEIAAADGPGARLIEVEHFVSRAEIDPVHYERTYHLGPGKDGEDAYRLLHTAMRRSDRVAIGRFVFHNRARLVAIRPLEEVLAMHAMRFADEVVTPDALEIAAPARKPTAREREMAQALIGQLDAAFEPERHHDTYREAVMELIRQKAAGEELQLEEVEAPAQAPDDLLAVLQASLDAGAPKGARGRSATPAKRRARAREPGGTPATGRPR